MLKVLRRNNDLVDFDRKKIESAIIKCFEEVEGKVTEHAEEMAHRIAYDIKKEYEDYNTRIADIEDIQDDIEEKLMIYGYNDIAKNYILYREKRKEIRDEQAKLYIESQNKIAEVMSNKNIENSNANVDESSFSGKNSKITSHFLKEYALDNLMIPKVAMAHRKGLLYTHDLDNYCSGMHNCLFIDFTDLFENNNGFETRNGDVRKPNDIMTFFQLVAVAFQCQSQVQYGGVGSAKIDYEGAPYVAITFKKCFKDALMDLNDVDEKTAQLMIKNIEDGYGDIIRLENKILKQHYKKEYKVAERHTIKKTQQGAESLYHNLNTLESRAGSQVPFTSINFGTDISPEGRLVSKSLLQASINGIGKFHRTSIFPISIFKMKSGVNKEPGTPNYDLKLLALESTSKRIYPNYVNVDISHQDKLPTCPDEENATMGCRTAIGYDINGMGWKRSGRGNISPVTLNLVDMGIRHGICLGEREEADIEGFFTELIEMLELEEEALLSRYEWIKSQKSKSGFFMHHNGTMKNTLDRKLEDDEIVEESMKHNTLAMGYIGIAECMKAMFGKHHGESKEAHKVAYKIVETINNYAKDATRRNGLNFSCYATPAESTCMTLMNKLKDTYGIIPGVTDRDFITNSHHIPVYYDISIQEKINLEAPFSKLATGGYIMYVELESTFVNNIKAIEKIIDYAMENDVAYFAINFPIDTCCECGYSSEINDKCPQCGSDLIERLRRVTGYLTTDYRNFNNGKIEEVKARVKHDTDNFKE